MKEKEGKTKKNTKPRNNTYTCITPTGNEFNKMLRDFYIHRLLISHFFFSCILRFPNHVHVYLSFFLSHSYFFSTPYFAFFSHFKSFFKKCYRIDRENQIYIYLLLFLYFFCMLLFYFQPYSSSIFDNINRFESD